MSNSELNPTILREYSLINDPALTHPLRLQRLASLLKSGLPESDLAAQVASISSYHSDLAASLMGQSRTRSGVKGAVLVAADLTVRDFYDHQMKSDKYDHLAPKYATNTLLNYADYLADKRIFFTKAGALSAITDQLEASILCSMDDTEARYAEKVVDSLADSVSEERDKLLQTVAKTGGLLVATVIGSSLLARKKRK